MAKFRFKYAVMSAGKSQELARVHYNYKIKGQNTLVLVPSIDNRNGIGVVSARSGEYLAAHAITPGEMDDWLDDYFKNNKENIACVLIDEVQFFTRKDIFKLKEKLVLDRDIPVIAYGLKSDFKAELFEGSAAAMIVAEQMYEIENVCAFCNKKAIMNMRFKNGKPVKEGNQIQIGDDEYKPVCHNHFLQENLKI